MSFGVTRLLLSQSYCSQSRQFFQRIPSLGSKHKRAYDKLIRSLVNAGIWNNLDVFYVFATSSNTTALQNLVSSSFTATENGGITFTTDRGYTGADASTTQFINSGFNNNQTGANYSQNNGHFSLWSNTNAASSASGGGNGVQTSGSSSTTCIFPKYSTGNAFFRINNTNNSDTGVAVSDSRGHYIASRNNSANVQGYINGVDQGAVNSVASTATIASPFYFCATRQGTGAVTGDGHQIMAGSIGAALTAGQASVFYNALHIYLQTIAQINY